MNPHLDIRAVPVASAMSSASYAARELPPDERERVLAHVREIVRTASRKDAVAFYRIVAAEQIELSPAGRRAAWDAMLSCWTGLDAGVTCWGVCCPHSDRPENPHVHIMVDGRDPATGRRIAVYRHMAYGPLRQRHAAAVNRVLSAEGLTERLDLRSYRERGVARVAEKHEGSRPRKPGPARDVWERRRAANRQTRALNAALDTITPARIAAVNACIEAWLGADSPDAAIRAWRAAARESGLRFRINQRGRLLTMIPAADGSPRWHRVDRLLGREPDDDGLACLTAALQAARDRAAHGPLRPRKFSPADSKSAVAVPAASVAAGLRDLSRAAAPSRPERAERRRGRPVDAIDRAQRSMQQALDDEPAWLRLLQPPVSVRGRDGRKHGLGR